MEPDLSATSTASDHDTTPLEELLKQAEERKAEGNDFFRSADLDDAIVAYKSALEILPKRKEKHRPQAARESFDDDKEDLASTSNTSAVTNADAVEEGHEETVDQEKAEPVSAVELECAKLRAALQANIGACYVKQAKHKEAVDACTEALLDDPNYVKALQRRATSGEKVNSWSSLTKAQEDYTALLKLLSPASSQYHDAEKALRLLGPRLEAAQKAETAEMMDKLKGLGNSILGNFGLSTDNFKFEPNGGGGYSMNFVR
ncbi:hypothetical protein HGRIS_007694 [Hohenbuehelia grisea]|uniref:Tetratricopeptide repeat protein 1 n=1 Tax=Hohenbuehelia grisea TaxID=104357 RepID=A0ABR3J5N8_9AGAR